MSARGEWIGILKGIRPHFSNRYMLEPEREWRGVPRPNHSLHHGMRQGFLALDICTIFNKGCYGWLSDELHKYCGDYFYIQALSSFQRSGRESEHSSTEQPDLNMHYRKRDRANFDSWASSSLKDKYDSSTLEEENRSMIGRIIKAAHQLDLQRIPSFCKERIYNCVEDLLFVRYHDETVKRKIFEELWRRSKEYLRVTGDRGEGRCNYSHHFVDLYREPEKMVDELIIAQNRLRGGC